MKECCVRQRHRRRLGLTPARLAIAVLALTLPLTSLTACMSSGDSGPSASEPCGHPASDRPSRYEHVVWVWLENHDSAQVIAAPSMPYLNRLANRCGLATNYHGVAHPSLPNYIAVTSGSTEGVTDDAGPSSHPLNAPSIFTQVGARSLQESMPANCSRADSGYYRVRHNPEAYYRSNTDCATTNVPLASTPNLSAPFTFVTPNVCNDGHDCRLARADSWLARFVPKVLDSREYRAGRTLLVITFDENDGRAGNRVPAVVVAPSIAQGTRDATLYTHYSLLRSVEDNFGVARLGNAATVTDMRRGLGY